MRNKIITAVLAGALYLFSPAKDMSEPVPVYRQPASTTRVSYAGEKYVQRSGSNVYEKGSVFGPPDVTEAQIEAYLRSRTAGPMTEMAHLFYKLGLEHDINPAFAAGATKLESDGGRSRIAREKNNLAGITNPDNTYKTYARPEDSIHEFFDIIDAYKGLGLRTRKEIARRYVGEDKPKNVKDWENGVSKIMRQIRNTKPGENLIFYRFSF